MNAVRILAVLATMSLTACSSRTVSDFRGHLESDPGWHHTWNEYRNSIYFGFVDVSKTVFWGTCDSGPIFMLTNGDYSFNAKTFTLTVDKQQWHLDVFQGEHERALVIDDPKIVEALYNAKNIVRFRVDDGWTREFKPADDLPQMIEECRSLRIADPDALGRLARYQTPKPTLSLASASIDLGPKADLRLPPFPTTSARPNGPHDGQTATAQWRTSHSRANDEL